MICLRFACHVRKETVPLHQIGWWPSLEYTNSWRTFRESFFTTWFCKINKISQQKLILHRRVIQRPKHRSQSVQNTLFHTPSYPSDKLMLRDDEARDLLKNAQQSRLRKVVGNLSSVVQLEMLMTQKWHRQLAGFIWFYGVLGISGISLLEVFLCNLLWRMSLVTSSMINPRFFSAVGKMWTTSKSHPSPLPGVGLPESHLGVWCWRGGSNGQRLNWTWHAASHVRPQCLI